jgi:hypothetical protein
MPALSLAPQNCLPTDVGAWAVAQTVSHGERRLDDYLKKLNVPSFLPMVIRRRSYSGRMKSWWIPLFPGYVFFDSTAIKRDDVFASRKVASILLPTDSTEIQSDLFRLSSVLQIDPTLRETKYTAGRQLIVARGPFKGIEGKLVRTGSQSKLVISISFLQKAVELAIDEAFIEPAL